MKTSTTIPTMPVLSVSPVRADDTSMLGFYFELYNGDWVAYALDPVDNHMARLGLFATAQAAINTIKEWHRLWQQHPL
jgi:hypothetical protein